MPRFKKIAFVASESKEAERAHKKLAKLYGDVPFDLESHAKVATGELAVLKKNPGAMGKALIDLAGQLHRPPAASATEKKPKLVEWLKGKKK